MTKFARIQNYITKMTWVSLKNQSSRDDFLVNHPLLQQTKNNSSEHKTPNSVLRKQSKIPPRKDLGFVTRIFAGDYAKPVSESSCLGSLPWAGPWVGCRGGAFPPRRERARDVLLEWGHRYTSTHIGTKKYIGPYKMGELASSLQPWRLVAAVECKGEDI